jgi:catechol 2,3-dioxygenase-like lactoylglutathione lyase family enzyme
MVSLSDYKVGAAVAVSNIATARDFYEGKLGLVVGTDSGDNVQYTCAESTALHIFQSPHAGTAKSTQAGWGVDDIESMVRDLRARGVTFERYDEGPIVTDADGIAHFEGGAKVAYFKDPDGNVLSIAEGPGSQ